MVCDDHLHLLEEASITESSIDYKVIVHYSLVLCLCVVQLIIVYHVHFLLQPKTETVPRNKRQPKKSNFLKDSIVVHVGFWFARDLPNYYPCRLTTNNNHVFFFRKVILILRLTKTVLQNDLFKISK